mmetsp:Transcript_14274/g.12135  ORF Transcript_14274/g.12135 Transcript_14274/m.12135 type:complete len:86 (-) Transcript_14274:1169-1426(-)
MNPFVIFVYSDNTFGEAVIFSYKLADSSDGPNITMDYQGDNEVFFKYNQTFFLINSQTKTPEIQLYEIQGSDFVSIKNISLPDKA